MGAKMNILSKKLGIKILMLFKSLGYATAEHKRIIKYLGSSDILQKRILKTFQDLHEHLITGFSHQQIIRIGARSGGLVNLTALSKYLNELQKLELTVNQMVAIVAHNGGSVNIAAILRHFTQLQALGFTTEQIVHIVSHCGGSKNITAVLESFTTLQMLGYTREQIENTVSHNGGSKHLYAIIENHYKSDERSTDEEYLMIDGTWVLNDLDISELIAVTHTTRTDSPALLFNYSPIRVDSPMPDCEQLDISNLSTPRKNKILLTKG